MAKTPLDPRIADAISILAHAFARKAHERNSKIYLLNGQPVAAIGDDAPPRKVFKLRPLTSAKRMDSKAPPKAKEGKDK